MEKTELDGSISSITVNKKYVYGYFRKDGSLYKIYMPKNTDKKFIKVENYTQGMDQLIINPTKVDNLIITSSLKDLMAFVKLGIPGIQAVAPDSENSMINSEIVYKLKSIFNRIIVLFDNDGPGIEAAKKYKEKYNFDYIVLDMEKDLSDSVQVHGLIKVKEKLTELLNELDISR
jgi:DNA primase